MFRATREEIAQLLHRYSVHDPYLLIFGPDNLDMPGLYLLRIMFAVPKDQASEHYWTAASLEQVRAIIPSTLVRWPRVRTTSQPALVEQWCLQR